MIDITLIIFFSPLSIHDVYNFASSYENINFISVNNNRNGQNSNRVVTNELSIRILVLMMMPIPMYIVCMRFGVVAVVVCLD